MPAQTLVLTGGGILGVTYAGAFRAMEEQGIQLRNFESVYGTSVGGLIGLLVVIGMPYSAIHRLLTTMPVSTIFRVSSNGILTMPDTGGIDSGSGLRRLIRSVLKRITGRSMLTFGDLYRKYPTKFTVNALDIRSGKQVLLGSQETPDVMVEDALCATAAIPGLYVPVRIRDMVLVDGGVWDSLLIGQVPEKDLPTTVALVPIAQSDPPSTRVDMMFIMRSSFHSLSTRAVQQCCDDPRYKNYIIRIPTPISSMMMLSEKADSSSIRETLDFIGYTEVSRSDVVKRFVDTVANPPQPELINQPTPLQQRIQERNEQTEPTTQPPKEHDNPRVVTTQSAGSITPTATTSYQQSTLEGMSTSRPGLDDSPYQGGGQLPADQGVSQGLSDTTLRPPPDTSSGSSHSLPPPVDTRELGGPAVAPVTYRPTV